MAKHEENFNRWSNAKKARIFAHVIGHLALKFGEDGVLKIPFETFDSEMTVGFDREGDDFLIAVDMDDHHT